VLTHVNAPPFFYFFFLLVQRRVESALFTCALSIAGQVRRRFFPPFFPFFFRRGPRRIRYPRVSLAPICPLFLSSVSRGGCGRDSLPPKQNHPPHSHRFGPPPVPPFFPSLFNRYKSRSCPFLNRPPLFFHRVVSNRPSASILFFFCLDKDRAAPASVSSLALVSSSLLSTIAPFEFLVSPFFHFSR